MDRLAVNFHGQYSYVVVNMAAGDICDVSVRCLRYKNMDFPLLDYMVAYLANKYDQETNPEVNISFPLFKSKNSCANIFMQSVR